jgi:hypothetical protein
MLLMFSTALVHRTANHALYDYGLVEWSQMKHTECYQTKHLHLLSEPDGCKGPDAAQPEPVAGTEQGTCADLV